jgi:hypothetical protein
MPYAAGVAAVEDRLGISVAVDGDTILVGAVLADIGGNGNQGAAYVFTRAGSTWSQQQKLVAEDGADSDFFGHAVSLDGDSALVGAYLATVGDNFQQGAAYVFTRAGSTWSQQQKLVAADGASGDYFGQTVSLDGDSALVGAYQANVGGNLYRGAAYVFTRAGSTWSQQQKLVAADGASGDFFGYAVSLDRDSALVGASGADVGGNSLQGAAYVFARTGSTWSQQQKLVAADGAASDFFGNAVSLDGGSALIGAHWADVGSNANQGAAYLFTRAGSTWNQQQKLVATDGASGDDFGFAVSLHGGSALVGAYAADVGGNLEQGAAYVFTRAGSTWSQQQKLVAGDGGSGDFFGYAAAIDQDAAVIGAPNADVGALVGAGKLYVSERGPIPWSELSLVTAGDGAAGDLFGHAVSLDADTALVGAVYAGEDHVGAAYVFVRDGPVWVQQQALVAGDGATNDRFGIAVSLDGDSALVGAYSASVGGNVAQGAAYVFTREGSTWSQQRKLIAGDGAAGGWFGIAVSLDGDSALVGAAGAEVGGNPGQGAAYVFTRDGSTWSQQQKLVAADGAEGDNFGDAVSLDGDSALVGAYFADVGGNVDQGAAYVFTRAGSTWSQQQKLVAADGAAGDRFGNGASLDKDSALVGAAGADVGGHINQGAAYIFTRDGSVWSQQQKLVAGDGAANDAFGESVALDGWTLVVGAHFADVAENLDEGAAYVFSGSGSSWSWEQKLLAGDNAPEVGNAEDNFGTSVALSGKTALVGAPNAVIADNAQGRAHFFERLPAHHSYHPLVSKQ